MNNGLFDPRRIFFKMRTNKRYWLPPALLVMAAIIAFGLTRPPVYHASATVMIRRPTIELRTMEQTYQIDDFLQTFKERIRGYEFLKRVASETGMITPENSDEESVLKLVERMRRAIQIQQHPRHIILTYDGNTKAQAENVVASIVEEFQLSAKLQFQDNTTRNIDALSAELDKAVEKLRLAERRLNDWRNEHPDVSDDIRTERTQRLSRRRDEHNLTRQQLQMAENALQDLRERIAGIEPELRGAVTPAVNQELMQLRKEQRDLQLKLDLLTQVNQYTDEHPEVWATRRQLALINDQISSATTDVSPTAVSVPNPEYTQLAEQIAQYETRIVELRTQAGEQLAEIAELESYRDRVLPLVEERADLQLAVEQARDEVERFKLALADAERTHRMGNAGAAPSFSLYDKPPATRRTPYMKFAAAGVAGGGCVGAAIILLLTLFDSTVRSVDEARLVLQMPVLGIFQRVTSPTQLRLQRRRRIYQAVGATSVLLLLVVIGVLGYQHFGADGNQIGTGILRLLAGRE